MTSPSFIDVQDLQVGMFIRLDLGWMSHPFPRSSFRIAGPEQIATIRSLGVRRLAWYPEKSALEGAAATPSATPSAAPAGAAASAGATAASAATATGAAPDPAGPEALAAARRRALLQAQLQAQREALQQCQAQYDEAANALQQVTALLDPQPLQAAAQAQALAGAIADKMLGQGELCIRLLSSASSERMVAHALNVTVVAMLMARALGWPDDELKDLGTGALLHDIGKLDLPARVHFPEDSLGSVELKAYRDHVPLGLARGQRMQLPPRALAVLGQHHEMADGSGFPAKLTLEAMAPAARLVALVNRYDKLCNPGPRGVPLTPHEAVSVLFAQNRGRFDTAILGSFIRMMGVYPAGSVVQLTDERFALVMQVNSSRPLKPSVLVHDPGVPRDEALLLNLELLPDLGIRRSLAPDKLPPAAADYLAPRPRLGYYFDLAEPTPATVELLLEEAS